MGPTAGSVSVYSHPYHSKHHTTDAACLCSILKAGSHCNADLRQCNVTDVLGQCEHCSSVIAVAVLMFGVSSEKFGSVKLFR